MAYGSKNTKSFNKAPAKPQGKTLPVYSLSLAKEEGLEKITGLFENKSRKGDIYFSGKDKEGNRFYMFPAEEGKAFAFTLKVKSPEEDAAMETLTGLFANESKSGTTYWSGKTKDDVQFMVFTNDPK